MIFRDMFRSGRQTSWRYRLRVANIIAMWVLLVVFVLIFITLITALINEAITNDDKRCIAAYGVEYDHKQVEKGNTYTTVCVNTETGEEKPVPEDNK